MIPSRFLRQTGWLLLLGSMGLGLAAQERTPWTASAFRGAPDPPPPYTTERVFTDATFFNPVSMVYSGDWQRFFVLERTGKLFSFPEDSNGSPELVVDLTEAIPGVQLAYGIAFDPEFDRNRFIYLCYIRQHKDPQGSAVARFRMPPGPKPSLDLNSRLELIHWLSGGHNGGCLKFGPEGYLYISTGDAEAPSPPDGLDTGQDLSDLLAGILRIDVRNSHEKQPYAIPPDNPFIDQEGARPEIWAYGMRNPWRMSFDRHTGSLWVGDVGWELYEMIYRVERGGNYGWSVVEGQQPVRQDARRGPTPILLPTTEHPHSEARSITGGYVYRGTRLPDLVGKYIYGDYVTGKMWTLPADAGPLSPPSELADSNLQVICYGEGPDGEVYAVGYVTGTLHRFIPNPDHHLSSTFPRTLSQSGLFARTQTHQLAPGVIPFELAATQWEDGTQAIRFLAVPEGQKLDRHRRNRLQQGELKDAWSYPEGSVFGKTVTLTRPSGPPRRLETQVLHRRQGRWHAYSYRWRDNQSDADLVPAAGQTITLPEVEGSASSSYRISSRTECILCHTIQAGGVLGFTEDQLAGVPDAEYKDQLARFAAQGYFRNEPLRKRNPFVNPDDPAQDIHRRARAYLHVNCAHCHRFGGGGTAVFDLRHELSDADTKLFSTLPIQGTFDIEHARVVAHGDPAASMLFYRMAKLGPGRMPHFGARSVDSKGLALLAEWIHSLPRDDSPGQLNGQGPVDLRQRQAHSITRFRRANDPFSPAAREAIDDLLSRTSGGIQLLMATEGLQFGLPVGHRRAAIDTALGHSDSRIRDLFLQYIPEDQRQPTIGLTTDGASILERTGNVEAGKTLVENHTGLRCLECHQIDDRGKDFGPRLDGIGSRQTREALLQSLLQPSLQIAPEFTAWTIETDEGDIYSGFILNETDKTIGVRDLVHGDIQIPSSAIQSRDRSTLSLMPQFLLQDLSPQQASDLLAYLKSLH